MSYHWSIHQLTEYLVAVSSQTDPRGAMRTALERIGEALEAELGMVAVGDEVHETLGFGGLAVPVAFRSAADGDVVDIPRLGEVHLVVGRLATPGGRRGIAGGVLVAGRVGEPFTAEERQMLDGMALSLGLLLHTLETLANERQRHRLVENLLQIQRAISARRPLPEVLDAVTSGASGLLGECPVALLLIDQVSANLAQVSEHNLPGADDALLAAARRALEPDAEATGPTGPGVLAERVVVGGEVVGCLTARTGSAPINGHRPADLLSAFAQQVSLALTDAKTLDAVHEAHRDPVTALPNRKLFLERLDRERAIALDEGGSLTVLFIDLDRFKAVNDTLGHQAGDELLAEVAHRILTCIGDVDSAARLGGDEFAVLLRADRRVGETVADRIIAALTRTFTIEDRAVLIGASVGVATLRAADQTAAGLLSDADVAMYCAKRSGRGRWVAFEPHMHDDVADQLSLRTDLNDALANGQLSLAYQPLVDLRSGSVAGVEALLRWNHPVRGAVPPSLFVPIAEDSDTIRTLGAWVIDQSLADLARWRAELPELYLAVNVSGRQLVDAQLAGTIDAALRREGLPGDSITLEITESVLMVEPDRTRVGLVALQRLGVRLAIDDFGTGYSSLAYLRQFPVNQVKIDRSFVAGLQHGAGDDVALLRSILELCRGLRLQTVAEGIEEAAQLSILAELGCDLGQGYFLARPAPASAQPQRLPVGAGYPRSG